MHSSKLRIAAHFVGILLAALVFYAYVVMLFAVFDKL